MPGSPGTPKASDSTVGALGEAALLHRIRSRVPPPPAWVPVGIGDDAAVVEPERNALEVLTTDALVEGVHFDRRWCSAADVGFRALAVNLSDLAAMGASPRVAVLSLALPSTLPVGDLDDLLEGFLEAASPHGLSLVGGNITRTIGPLVVDVTAVGAVRPRRVLTRDRAKPGDALYVSGTLGASAVGLECLLEGAANRAGAEDPPPELADCVARYRRPGARLRLGVLVGRNRAASACIDLSDGLADGVRQLARASGTGARVEAEAVPVDPSARAWWTMKGCDPVRSAMAGGDDYELLFAVPRRLARRFLAAARLVRSLPVTRIGVMTEPPDLVLSQDGLDHPIPEGFSHFSQAG